MSPIHKIKQDFSGPSRSGQSLGEYRVTDVHVNGQFQVRTAIELHEAHFVAEYCTVVSFSN